MTLGGEQGQAQTSEYELDEDDTDSVGDTYTQDELEAIELIWEHLRTVFLLHGYLNYTLDIPASYAAIKGTWRIREQRSCPSASELRRLIDDENRARVQVFAALSAITPAAAQFLIKTESFTDADKGEVVESTSLREVLLWQRGTHFLRPVAQTGAAARRLKQKAKQAEKLSKKLAAGN